MEGKIDQVHTGDLVLDIGDGIAALIIHTRGDLRGEEIEVSLKGVESPRMHTVVQQRRVGSRTECAGIFPELPAGEYRIWTDDPGRPASVTIVSGEVVEVDWR